MDDRLTKAVKAALCVFLAVLSFFVLGKIFSDPSTFSGLIRSLDDKVSTTLKLTGAATAASAGVSAIPEDICTPIAEKLADFSEYGFFILCVLYTEKYLMTILGEAAFRWIVPIGCLLYIAAMLLRSKRAERFVVKVILVSLALFLVIPLGIKVSDRIYDTYRASIDSTLSQAESLAEDTSLLAEANKDPNVIREVFRYLASSASELADRASRLLNRFIESTAVLIVTSCLIPLVVLIFSLWIIKQFLGINLPLPASKYAAAKNPREKSSQPREAAEEREEIGTGV